MGKLMGFLGGFAGSMADQMKLDRADKKRKEEKDEEFKMQLSYAKAAAAMQQNLKTNTAVPTPQADGPVVQDEDGNWVQKTRIESGALVDDNLNVTRAPSLIAGPTQAAINPNALTPAQAETARQKDLDRASRENAARIRGRSRGGSSRAPIGEDGLTADQRADNKRADEREERLRNQRSGSGGMTEKGWRDGMDSTLSSIQGADAGKLKSMIRQYGGDNIITGEMDEDMLREAAFSVAETYWNERKPSNKKAGEEGGGKPGASESNPVTTTTKADVEKLPKGTWFITPAGRTYQK